MRCRERGERQHVGPGVAHRLGGFGEPVSERVGHLVPPGTDLAGCGEREDRPEHRGDHLLGSFRDHSEEVPDVVDFAALPRRTLETLADRRFQPGVSVGDHEADTVQPAGLE